MFTYRPAEVAKDEYIIARNEKLAKYLATILGIDFLGDFTTAVEHRAKLEYVFPHDVISSEDARILGIKSDSQIYGSVSDKLYARKSIFHSPVPDPHYIPSNFPHEFSSALLKSGITLPGYTAFTVSDISKAYDLLINQNLVPRIKDPRGASGMMQRVIRNRADLEDALSVIDSYDITKYGIVIEANVIGIDEDKVPKAFSGGWVSLNNQIYSYIGDQLMSTNEIDMKKYLGTQMRIVRGHVEELFKLCNLPEDLLCSVTKLYDIRELVNLLPTIINTRYNFDFIYGSLDAVDGKIDENPTMFLVDQSFRAGAATIAEFIGIEELIQHPELNEVKTRVSVDLGENCKKDLPKNAIMFYSGIDPIYGQIRTWGELLEV